MSGKYLTDKYASYLMQPGIVRRDADLVAFMAANGITGTFFHILQEIYEQGEDLYWILVDDHSVSVFEIPRRSEDEPVEPFRVFSFNQYRRDLGQGKSRMRLDRAAAEYRRLMAVAEDVDHC